MSKGSGGGSKGGSKGGGSKGSGRGPSNHPGPGGNWQSTTPNPSGGDRGNATPKGK
jgi:hypothetical protein